jgi:hypothetical protein
MWRLSEFLIDEEIPGDEIYLYGEDGVELTQKPGAIDRARERGHRLYAWWPGKWSDESPMFCRTGPVALPLRWEESDVGEFAIDERLWFVGTCGERDFLVDGHGHTFRGRMSAWCPTQQHWYNVSKAAITECSTETEFFIRGFLTGCEPGPPIDDEGEMNEADHKAWRAAAQRFHSTGYWYGRWTTCDVCGRVLLPDTDAEVCESHAHEEAR